MTLLTDGSFAPCFSWHSYATLKDSFWKIYNGRDIRAWRRKAMNGREMPDADCKNCLMNVEPKLSQYVDARTL